MTNGNGNTFPQWLAPVVGSLVSVLLAGNLYFANKILDEVKGEIKELKGQTAGLVDLRIEVMILKNAVAELQKAIDKGRK